MKIAFFGLNGKEKETNYSNSLTGYEVTFFDQDLNEENIPEDVSADIISVFVRSKITSQVIDAFPNLKMIALRSTGFDNVDIKHAQKKNIVVSNVPDYGSHTVAEFTFGLILSLSRKIPEAIEKVKVGRQFNSEGLKGFDLFGKTLGVIGTGKIGMNVIKIAKGFGLNVLAVDTYPKEELASSLGFEYVDLEQLLKESDIVTIHVPSTNQTRHLINQENISASKKGAIIINTARGDVVETSALSRAISEGSLAGAGLDVLEDETNLSNDPATMELMENPNVYITPHTAFNTNEAEEAILQATVDNIKGYIGGSPKNLVK